MVVVGHGMQTGQLSFEGSWILLLNNNSRKLVPITDSSGGGPPSQRSAIAKVRHRKGFSLSDKKLL